MSVLLFFPPPLRLHSPSSLSLSRPLFPHFPSPLPSPQRSKRKGVNVWGVGLVVLYFFFPCSFFPPPLIWTVGKGDRRHREKERGEGVCGERGGGVWTPVSSSSSSSFFLGGERGCGEEWVRSRVHAHVLIHSQMAEPLSFLSFLPTSMKVVGRGLWASKLNFSSSTPVWGERRGGGWVGWGGWMWGGSHTELKVGRLCISAGHLGNNVALRFADLLNLGLQLLLCSGRGGGVGVVGWWRCDEKK